MTESATAAPNTSIFGRRYGNLVWDGVLRGTGAAAFLAIPGIYVFPAIGPLVGFVLVTIWVNGPLAFFFPATYEPILMLFGRIYLPLLIGALGIAGIIYVEYLNYRLYEKALNSRWLTGLRQSKTTQRMTALFRRAPFFTVWLCSWSILPYWSVRVLSPLAGFPVSKHLWATFMGRFPRLWFFASLGRFWSVDLRILFALSFVAIFVAVILSLVRRRRPDRGSDPALVGRGVRPPRTS